MKITLEGTMEEIELLALAVATGCQALRGSGADAPHPHEREGNRAAKPAEGRFMVYSQSMTDENEEPHLIDMTAQTLETAVARAVNWIDAHAGEGKRAYVMQQYDDGCWREVWPNG